ncbi:hypothetical protein QA641_27665 [Bradyrhizobium sp. CB1650]|uniref:hypothetical protein n=1 Tax=Bradyrhizobium sp. CB1650 TaxID=3039153 RepID=UPI002434E0CC|nr:hypothetical protein [Bradyrhizobium sp. CB1650]WGD49400.1 hypothetical protein QA641_27665 [Bradyrhizobium sp. CB1650]
MHPDIPFSTTRLDSMLDDFGIEVLIATSKHNIQYLLGGPRRWKPASRKKI